MLFKILKLISFNLLITLIFLLSIEFIYLFLKSDDIYCEYLLCNVNYETKHNFFKKQYTLNYSKDKYGFRNYKPEGDIIFLSLGGSTVDQRYLNLEDTWTFYLEKLINQKSNFNYNIVNAGIDGQSTFGNIWNYDNWFQKANLKDINTTIILIGINDLIPKKHNDRYDNIYINANYINKIKKYLADNTFGISLLKIYRKYLSNKFNLKHDKYKIDKTKFTVQKSLSNNDLKFYIDNYLKIDFKNKLDQLYKKNLSLNKNLILVTQRTLRWLYINNEYLGHIDYPNIEVDYKSKNFLINSADLGLLEKELADYLIDYCYTNNIICINGFNFDLNFEDSYDLMHKNPLGSRKFAHQIYENLINMKLIN